MKRILSVAAVYPLMAASTYAATLTFAWDPKPADQKRKGFSGKIMVGLDLMRFDPSSPSDK